MSPTYTKRHGASWVAVFCYAVWVPRVIFGLLLAVLLAVGSTGLAQAQSRTELAAARELFRDGLQAARAGDWDSARSRFERSYAIAPRPNTLLNLAGARQQTGALVAAAEDYRTFLSEATGRARRLRPQAQAALEDVEARIAHVQIELDGLMPSDLVTLDSVELAHAALGVDIPVDPGAHLLAVTRGATEALQERFTLTDGERQELAFDVGVSLAPATGPSTEAPAAAFEGDPLEDGEGGDDSGVIIGVVIGVAAAVAFAATVTTVVVLDSAGPHQGSLGDGVIAFD